MIHVRRRALATAAVRGRPAACGWVRQGWAPSNVAAPAAAVDRAAFATRAGSTANVDFMGAKDVRASIPTPPPPLPIDRHQPAFPLRVWRLIHPRTHAGSRIGRAGAGHASLSQLKPPEPCCHPYY